MAAASPVARTKIPVVLGSMMFGKAGTEAVRISDLDTAKAMLDTFQAHGHGEIDTARTYGNGTTERFLAQAGWRERGLVVHTKLYPTVRRQMGNITIGYTMEPASVRQGLAESLEALGTDRFDLWYLHGPDRQVPLADTLREVDALHRQGKFARLGISNFAAWEVARMHELCEANGWVRPTVYQGVYNALHRGIELELVPCLRHYGIALYGFQPLGGGFLTGRYRRETADDAVQPGGRFDPTRLQGKNHRARYFNDAYFDAVELIQAAGGKHGLTVAECAVRWLSHHSVLSADKGDKIIVGASSVTQLESNLGDLEKGPLPTDVVEAMEAAWLRVKGVAPKYFH